jgi:short-subunit dehydrogenase
MSRTALITGASAGIGKAFAEHLAADGFDLVLVARRRERLEDLSLALSEKYGIRAHVVAADLANAAAPQEIFDALANKRIDVDVLINNAGFGVRHTFLNAPWETHATLIQVQVTAVAHLTHLFLPNMLERGYGRILHVASLAGLLPGAPTSTLYAAAKSFLVKFSESLTAEVKGKGVYVCAVCPGFTLSEFHDVMGTRSIVSKLPSALWQNAEQVAREGIDAVMRGDVVYVPGPVNRALATIMQHLPPRAARGLMSKSGSRYRDVPKNA